MRHSAALLLLFMAIAGTPVSAMRIDADPRIIVSFMDKSLPPELDILQVTVDLSADNHLVFEVKTRGERVDGDGADYLLLHIRHGKARVLLIPVNQGKGDAIAMYESALQPGMQPALPRILEEPGSLAGLGARRISRGAEFRVPLDWIDFGDTFGFDAYTVRADERQGILEIHQIYDQAGKGRDQERLPSAITLLNRLCTPQRLRPE